MLSLPISVINGVVLFPCLRKSSYKMNLQWILLLKSLTPGGNDALRTLK